MTGRQTDRPKDEQIWLKRFTLLKKTIGGDLVKQATSKPLSNETVAERMMKWLKMLKPNLLKS